MSHDLVDGAALVSYHIEMCFCDKCDCLVRIVSTVTHIKKPVCLSCEEGHHAFAGKRYAR